MKESNYKRCTYIDEVAGLLIINMILGHCIQRTGMTDNGLYQCMNALSFFMPWFFYKSGMFNKNRSIKDTAINGWYKLMRPYINWSIIGFIPYCLLKLANHDYVWYHYVLSPFKGILLNGQYSGNSPLWFLINLWIIQIIYSLSGRLNLLKYMYPPLGITIGYFCHSYGLSSPSYIASISTGLTFYSMGYICRDIQYKKSIFAVSLVIYALFLFYGISFVDINMNQLICGKYLLWPIFALSGIICINNLFKYGEQIISAIKIFDHIGQNSMFYYVSHWIIINVGLLLFRHLFHLEKDFLLYACVLLCVILLPLISMIRKRGILKHFLERKINIENN